jgi:hypothetical protein
MSPSLTNAAMIKVLLDDCSLSAKSFEAGWPVGRLPSTHQAAGPPSSGPLRGLGSGVLAAFGCVPLRRTALRTKRLSKPRSPCCVAPKKSCLQAVLSGRTARKKPASCVLVESLAAAFRSRPSEEKSIHRPIPRPREIDRQRPRTSVLSFLGKALRCPRPPFPAGQHSKAPGFMEVPANRSGLL